MTLDQLKMHSDEALHELADRLGLELPEGLDRIFVIEEVYEALEEDRWEEEEESSPALRIGEKKFAVSPSQTEPAKDPLPATYNDTYIRLMPRDPLWAYAYWDIKESELAALALGHVQAALFLRVEQMEGETVVDRFDIPVKHEDRSWYFNIPVPGATYRIALYALCGKKETGIARSAAIRTPAKAISRYLAQSSGDFDALLELSGYGSLGLEGDGE